jgi:hypothetical protein
MATKVLRLLWALAHSDDVPTEIMDQALTAHTTILDYSCSQDRDTQKTYWLEKCVQEIKLGRWVIPTLKQIREICCLYAEQYGGGNTGSVYGSVSGGIAPGGSGGHHHGHHVSGGSTSLYQNSHSSKGPHTTPR